MAFLCMGKKANNVIHFQKNITNNWQIQRWSLFVQNSHDLKIAKDEKNHHF